MTKDEALKMAIEALEQYVDVVGHKFNAETWGDIEDKGNPAREAINACKEALEQPTVAELNDEYLRDTYVEGLNQPAQEPLTQEKYEQLKNQSTQWTSSLPMFVHLINKHFGVDDGLDWGKR
jgi:hypothetical protein